MRRKKESRRPLAITFVVTVILLSGLALGLFLTKPGVEVQHLPSSVPEYSASWARYVPSTALLFGFENYTLVRQYATYPLYDALITLPDQNLKLSGGSIDAELTMVLRTPNESVDIAYVSSGVFRNFSAAFSDQNVSAVRVGDASMYYVRNYGSGQFQFGWLALVPSDRVIAFAIGANDAKTALQECLQVRAGSLDSVVSRTDVRQMLYIVNGTEGHLSIGLQDFPGLVQAGGSTLTAVDAVGSSVHVRRVVEFADAQTALDQWTQVRSSYLNAHQFTVFDSFVEATTVGTASDLVTDVRLVE